MSYTSKSPIDVAREALRAAEQALRPYAHKYSPKKFTQPQLFACLVLKTFFKTDYRGIVIYLEDLPQSSIGRLACRRPADHQAIDLTGSPDGHAHRPLLLVRSGLGVAA